MRAVVSKWGNSASVRIPAAILDQARLQLNQQVTIRVENGRVVIEALRDEYDLDALIDGITDENRHAATDIGKPVGAEIW
jgi:antitoxin MazE